MDPIDELRAAVHRDPRGVAEKANEFATAARAGADPVLLSRSLGALGRARRSLGEIDLAELDFAGALAAAAEARDDELAADAHIGLAGVLLFAGRFAEAFEHLNEADLLGSERLRAYAALQRAVIEQNIGHMAEALAMYESALPTLRRLNAEVDLALVLMNRGVIRTQSGDCDGAIADLAEAGELFARDHNDFGVAQTDHGLGWAYARRGDLPHALRLLDRAAQRFHNLGHDALEVDVDRTEVLLSAGLFTEAAEVGLETAKRLRAAGNRARAAEAWLLCARAALLDGDRSSAAAYAGWARTEFAHQGAVGWERAARLEALLASDDVGDAAALRGLAGELGGAGNARGAVTALALACVAACEHGDLPHATQLAAECERRAISLGVFEVRMMATYATASCAVAHGDDSAANERVRSGLDDLRQYRESLAATDARASVSVHAAQLSTLGLRLALRDGSAPVMLEWMERARAGRAHYLRPRPPDDSHLAADLAELRRVVAQSYARESEGMDTTDLLHTQRDLERAIHRRQLHIDGHDSADRATPPTVRELQAVLQSGTLIALGGVDGRMVGVVVDRRQATMADIGSVNDLTELAMTTGSVLRALVTPAQSRIARATKLDVFTRALTALDRTMAPLATGDGPVILVVPPVLHTVAWQLLACFNHRPVVVAPSATWWHAATSASPAMAAGPPPSTSPAASTSTNPVIVVAGPRLVEAEREAAAVADCHRGAKLLTGSAATAEAVTMALTEARIAHIACHGRIRPDNPLWSSLELHDGPLYVYDLERLRRTPPLVVLAGCETGVGVRSGDKLLGLSTTLLEHGTRCLVASLCPLPDSPEVRDTMVALHQRIDAGISPSEALAELVAGEIRDDALLAACLASFGTH